MSFLKERLQEILIKDHLISTKDFDRALKEQKKVGGDLSSILITLKLIDEDSLTIALSEGLGMPPMNISRLKIDPEVIKLIPKDFVIKNKVMPISVIGDNITMAMADPLNIFVMDNVKALTGYTITPIISRPKDLENSIKKYYEDDEEEDEDVDTSQAFDDIIQDIKDTEELELVKDAHHGDDSKIEELTDEAPIIRLTDSILQQAVKAKASDVFIEPLTKDMRVRYRIDGVIQEVDRMSKAILYPLVSRIKVISSLDISEHRLPQDGRFRTIMSGNKSVDFRVNVLPTALGEKVCLRILDQSAAVVNIDNLGFEPLALERLKQCSIQPHGLILACGPTGSGKTTTLYSILKNIDSPQKNIVTVEDPVEFQMEGINQVNIKASMGLTFATSLRSILRQDPDIIMIGEIRDTETLDIAVKAALTGHLVLSSLHTTTAAGSIIRMRNMGVEPFLMCSSCLAIVAQRLLRRICSKCKESYTLSETAAEKTGLTRLTGKKKMELFRGKGCKACKDLGYKGRVGITEILTFTPKVKAKILVNAGEPEIKNIARREGMVTMREDGLTTALAGLTTIEEVVRITAPDEILKQFDKDISN